MADAVGASVLRHVLQDVRRNGGEFSDAHGQLLAALSADNLQLLQAASELVEKRAVRKVTALPSRRVFFRVESLNRYHQQQAHASATSQPYHASAVSGNGPNYYNCFDHYCSCSAFHLTTVKTPSAMCKHIVALLLADATSQCVPMTKISTSPRCCVRNSSNSQIYRFQLIPN